MSNCPTDHPLFSAANKMVICKMKEEEEEGLARS
jgi:hypothetical protein